MFSKFRNCKFERCAYTHDQDKSNINIDELKYEVIELKESIKKLSESSKNEAKIKTLEEEVKILKLEIKRLFAFTKKLRNKNEEIPSMIYEEIPVKIHEEISDKIQEEVPYKIHEEVLNVKINEEMSNGPDIPAKIKCMCELCGSSFKKEITLKKHKNTKHNPNSCPNIEKIGEGKFGFAFDVRPGQEAAAEALRLEWSEKKKEDKAEQQNSVNDENSKES